MAANKKSSALEELGLEGLAEFADELRTAVTDLLDVELEDGQEEDRADELLRNGRAIALGIQELAARVELLNATVWDRVELLVDALGELAQDGDT